MDEKDVKKINCDEVMENLAEYLDPEEKAELCREIEEHLKHCHDCQVEVDQVKKTIVLYQSDRETPIPLRISQGLRAALSRTYIRKD